MWFLRYACRQTDRQTRSSQYSAPLMGAKWLVYQQFFLCEWMSKVAAAESFRGFLQIVSMSHSRATTADDWMRPDSFLTMALYKLFTYLLTIAAQMLIGRVSYIRIYLCYFCFRWKTVSLVQASVQHLMHHVTVSLQQSKITLQNNCINNTSITQPTLSFYLWLKM